MAGAVDGRTARSMRTKAAIVDACLALVDSGDLRPTAPRVAERAGVSVRSVFQHFADLDALFTAVGDEAVRPAEDPGARARTGAAPRRAHRRHRRPPHGTARGAHAVAPVDRRQRLGTRRSPPTASGSGTRCSGIELAAGASPPELGDDVQLLDAIDVALSWPTWEQLRTLVGLDEAAAAAVVARIVRDRCSAPSTNSVGDDGAAAETRSRRRTADPAVLAPWLVELAVTAGGLVRSYLPGARSMPARASG